MPNTSTENWKEELKDRFTMQHSQMTHLNKREDKKNCDICKTQKLKNPKGYYLTFLSEQKCYWNREMYDDMIAFIESLLATREREIAEGLAALGQTKARNLWEYEMVVPVDDIKKYFASLSDNTTL
jgi:hypothetical protein